MDSSTKYRQLNEPSRHIPYRKLLNSTVPLLILMILAAQLTKLFYRTNYEDQHFDFELSASVNDGLNITGYADFIVPNNIHLIRFDNPEIDFITYVAIKSALVNHSPQYLYIHCNEYPRGKYWEKVKNEPSIVINKFDKPTSIFGRQLSSDYNVYHASDIARLEILMKYGGIYIDSDVFVVKSLNYFRKFEMSIGWPDGENIGNQVLIAHRDSRFLKLWYESYRDYQGDKWYYNAGHLPTKTILEKNPDLVHREPENLGVQNLAKMLYEENVEGSKWRKFYTIHLLSRHADYLVPKTNLENLNEFNIKTYNTTFGAMTRLLLFGDEKMIV